MRPVQSSLTSSQFQPFFSKHRLSHRRQFSAAVELAVCDLFRFLCVGDFCCDLDAAMTAISVGLSFAPELKLVPTGRRSLGSRPSETREAKRVSSGFNPLGVTSVGKRALRRASSKTPSRLAAESTAVETLPTAGPESHAVQWDTAEERVPQELDGDPSVGDQQRF